ncbi:unnamed protein product [Candida verbasci]|uniref:Proteasome assembly chaperone 2 n=1 Tax=Candida verbasci TaxID=1227364 RepID=A0A9W4TUV4_9ASCO|nr:unnamed protein product [Candida verbasci]
MSSPPFNIFTSINNSTLIIPSISIGNIPQLAIDLLIHTYSFSKIGKINDFYLYPFASAIDHDPSIIENNFGITSSCEIYFNKDLQLTLIQQRSPIISSYTIPYINEVLLPFILENKFKHVILLDSFDAGLVENIKQGDIKIFNQDDLLNKSLKELELNNNKLIDENDNNKDKDKNENVDFVELLIKELIKPRKNPFDVSVFISYVYEGDNFQDGEKLANKLIEELNIKNVKQWIRPISWLGAYGDKPVPNSMEQGLYG